MTDDQPTDDELREAAALAEALEAKEPGSGAPADALEAAQLLRFTSDGGALSKEQLERGRAEVEARVGRRKHARWMGMAAAAAIVLVVGGVATLHRQAPRSAPPAPVDAAELAVLRAQAQAIASRDPGKLELAMQRYRRSWLTQLGQGYGGSP